MGVGEYEPMRQKNRQVLQRCCCEKSSPATHCTRTEARRGGELERECAIARGKGTECKQDQTGSLFAVAQERDADERGG